MAIANIRVDEAGNYTCVAYTSGPIRSEDQASATIDVSGIKVLFLWYIYYYYYYTTTV